MWSFDLAVVKGTRDILYPETEFLFELQNKIHNTFSAYGFEEISTPIMEYTELFKRSIGDFTDIVQKEMFTFKDRKGRDICLRPEGTAGVIRAYIDNGFAFKSGITKLYYSGAMFRAERPQKGRLREFHQFGCEAVGSNSPLLDAEIIKMNLELLNNIGLDNLKLKINSVGCRDCRKDYLEGLKNFLMDNYNELCDDCKVRAENNPLRVFDCKNEKCQDIYSNAPMLTDNLCESCNAHFEEVKKYLDIMNIKYEIDNKLVRGFDYYTNTVFEITTGVLGAQNAILGGGRYNYLVEHLGGKPAPAVGAAAGIERIYIALTESNKIKPGKEKKRIFIVTAGDVDISVKLKVADFFRNNNIPALFSYDSKSLKSQFKEADKLKCNLVVVIGEEELKDNKITLKDLNTGKQRQIYLDELFNNIKIIEEV